MFAGPIIAREVLTAPRPARYYLGRASFSCFLFILMWTAWQSIIGWQTVTELGVVARFGGILYWMFAMLQLTLMLFFAPLFTAATVSYEKDRRTFTLLLMTDLSDLEIVLGKLVAGLLNVLTILAASVGLLFLCTLLGGISFGQVANLFAVTAASGVAGGALGLLIALWRDRTFQSISLTILMVVFSVAGVEAFAIAFPTAEFMGVPLVEVLNPYRAMLAVLYPRSGELDRRGPGVEPGLHRLPPDVRGAPGRVRDLEAPQLESGEERAAGAEGGRGDRGHRDPRRGRGRGGIGRGPGRRRRGGDGRGRSAARWGERPTSLASPTIEGHYRGLHGRSGGGAPAGEPGPTTGLHVPRRTHRRIGAAARSLPAALGQSDPLARADDPRLRHAAPHRQGVLHPALRHGHGRVLPTRDAGWRTRCNPAWP